MVEGHIVERRHPNQQDAKMPTYVSFRRNTGGGMTALGLLDSKSSHRCFVSLVSVERKSDPEDKAHKDYRPLQCCTIYRRGREGGTEGEELRVRPRQCYKNK